METPRLCCYVDADWKRCPRSAVYEVRFDSSERYDSTDACVEHLGPLMDRPAYVSQIDSPETH